MIRTLWAPVDPRYQQPTERTPGRYEGLLRFAQKLSGLFGSTLKAWTVLDVGGADGWLGEMLVCRRYVCLDLRHAASWSGFLGLGEALPIKDRAVDLVVSKQTLPHFVHPALACQEMVRVARAAVVIRQDWGVRTTDGTYGPVGWSGHSRSQIDHPDDILGALTAPGGITATYDGEDFLARRWL